MPIGAITMILTNVGLQIFNNWCGSRQNSQLQHKREEFETAARERNTQRMWQLMREGQEITCQLEEEKHKQRIEELKNDIGSLLQKLAYSATISNWPLNVLPIVMKNQALGNLLANQEERIALHCILTPSNSSDFNRLVFPQVENVLEDYSNKYWSVMSERPILFYSGAWKTQQVPTEIQLDSMRAALSNLPMLVITPFFRPKDGKLVFQVRLWGVGSLSNDEFSIPEIEPTEFQRDYNSLDEHGDSPEFWDDMVEDIIPYLQCLIGYIADTFFWSSSSLAPHLPWLISNDIINTDGMKYLIDNSRELYANLIESTVQNSHSDFFINEKNLDLYEGIEILYDKARKKTLLGNLFLKYCNNITASKFNNINDALNNTVFSYNDVRVLSKVKDITDDEFTLDVIRGQIERLSNNVHCLIVENENLNIEDVLDWCYDIIKLNPFVHYVSIDISENNVVASMLNSQKGYLDNEQNPMCCVFTFSNLIIPEFLIIKKNKLLLEVAKFINIYNQIRN